MTLKRDDACVCKPELFRSQEQPQSLRTPPPADWKALKQKSLCFHTKNIFTNVYLPERHHSSNEEQIQSFGEQGQFAVIFLMNIFLLFFLNNKKNEIKVMKHIVISVKINSL